MNGALSNGERRGFVTHKKPDSAAAHWELSHCGLLGVVCGKKEEFVKLDFLKSLWA